MDFFSSFRVFGIEHIWYSAFGGYGLWSNEFKTKNKIPPIKKGFYGVASGGDG
jgi:hypothetical protein